MEIFDGEDQPFRGEALSPAACNELDRMAYAKTA